jgi:hypothetical protein
MPLRNRDRDIPPEIEPLLQGQLFAGLDPAADSLADDRGVASPRHNLVEKNISVQHDYLPAGEFDHMPRGDVRVMIAGEQRHRCRRRARKRINCLTALERMLGSVTRARVERVAVQHDTVDIVEQRPQLLQPANPAGAVAKVDVGKNADGVSGHGNRRQSALALGAIAKVEQFPCNSRPSAGTRNAAIRRFLMNASLTLFTGAILRRKLGWGALAACLIAASSLGADRAEDLARIHVAAIGGREHIAALTALRATGHVIVNGQKVGFTMIAERPNRVRLETDRGGRTLVQSSDGVGEPWEFDTGQWPPHYRAMDPAAAKIFAADAEFDDPLVGGPERGFQIEYAGETELDGRKFARLLVTRKLVENFSLLLDPDTCFIMMRIDERANAGGKIQVVTRYTDFRPVEGVLLPFEITTSVGNRVSQRTKIDAIEANPKLADDTFVRPMVPVAPAK